jgi:hypothetical protein
VSLAASVNHRWTAGKSRDGFPRPELWSFLRHETWWLVWRRRRPACVMTAQKRVATHINLQKERATCLVQMAGLHNNGSKVRNKRGGVKQPLRGETGAKVGLKLEQREFCDCVVNSWCGAGERCAVETVETDDGGKRNQNAGVSEQGANSNEAWTKRWDLYVCFCLFFSFFSPFFPDEDDERGTN